jgi:hypothetical protein
MQTYGFTTPIPIRSASHMSGHGLPSRTALVRNRDSYAGQPDIWMPSALPLGLSTLEGMSSQTFVRH